PADQFGNAVSLNAAGDRLAVGAPADGGFGNANFSFGAVHLFTFTDTSFSGGALAATLGSGYTGGKNVNVALDRNDQFGYSVSLNAAGDRLAVGAPNDAGATNANASSGAVRLFTFSDTSFSGGALAATLGSGYTGGKNVNVTLDNSDSFGAAVSFNAAGDRLAVGAPLDGGFGNANSNSGAVYLFTGTFPAQSYGYADRPEQSITVKRSDLERVLGQGTAVSLQASNDITLASALTVNNPSGNGGALTLQAGRSVLINQSIVSDNGNLTLIGNDTLANGVIDAQRDAGSAVITKAPGATINAGTGAVSIALRTGAGLTNSTSGAITLDGITAGSLSVVNSGPSGGNIVINNGAVLVASGAVDALVLAAASGGNFVNNAGAAALSAPAGRWLVWSTNPASDTRGGLVYDFKQYNATFGVTAPAQGTGNGLLYTLAPSITPELTGPLTKVYDGATTATLTAANFTLTGVADGDTVTLAGAGAYDNRNAGTAKPVSASGISIASSTNGAAPVYGYTLGTTAAAGNVGEITRRPITVTAATDTRIYDGSTTSTAIPTITSGTLAPVGGDSAAFIETFDTRNVGTNKTLTPSGFVNDGNSGNNYAITFANNTTGVINPRPITVTANDAGKIYGDADPALTFNIGGAGLVAGETLAGALTRAPGENVVGSPYAINQATLAASANYALTYTPGRFNIAPRALTVTADNKVKLLSDPLPPFTATYAGFAFADTPATLNGSLMFATPATAASPIGLYSITPFGQSSTNYNIAFVDGVLTIPLAGSLPPGARDAIASVHADSGGLGNPPRVIDQLITLDGPGVRLPPGVQP
ncbi:MAG TPA: MBG domain-containing protein, partial [Burkholderiales bacterium]|nr:MBG domain-containing protein [Burkholderiales bacterium]